MIVNHTFLFIIYINMYESNIWVNLYDQINYLSTTIMKNYVSPFQRTVAQTKVKTH